jgi:hypothetical protein
MSAAVPRLKIRIRQKNQCLGTKVIAAMSSDEKQSTATQPHCSATELSFPEMTSECQSRCRSPTMLLHECVSASLCCISFRKVCSDKPESSYRDRSNSCRTKFCVTNRLPAHSRGRVRPLVVKCSYVTSGCEPGRTLSPCST